MAEIRDILGQPYDGAVTCEVLSGLLGEETEQIGDRHYVTFDGEGLSLVLLSDMTVEAVQFHAEGHEEFHGYPHPLPGDIQFTTDRNEARARLGMPDRYTESLTVPVLGLQPPWDSFVLNGLALHLLYTPDADAIQMVTLRKA